MTKIQGRMKITWDSLADLRVSCTCFVCNTTVTRSFIDFLICYMTNHYFVDLLMWTISLYCAVLDASTKGNRYINSCLRYYLTPNLSAFGLNCIGNGFNITIQQAHAYDVKMSFMVYAIHEPDVGMSLRLFLLIVYVHKMVT